MASLREIWSGVVDRSPLASLLPASGLSRLQADVAEVAAASAASAAPANSAASAASDPNVHRFVHEILLVEPCAVADQKNQTIVTMDTTENPAMRDDLLARERHVRITVRPDASRCGLGYMGCEFVCVLQYLDVAKYPSAMPRLSFTSNIIHYTLDPHNQCLREGHEDFIVSALLKDSDFRVQEIIRILDERFFGGALHPCEHCDELFELHCKAHFYTHVNNALKYSALRCRSEFQNTLFATDLNGWPPEWFHPDFYHAVVQSGDYPASNRQFVQETGCPGVFTFPMFTKSFCDNLMQELDLYYNCGLPCPRPNSMNNYGLILNSIGLEAQFTRLQRDVLSS